MWADETVEVSDLGVETGADVVDVVSHGGGVPGGVFGAGDLPEDSVHVPSPGCQLGHCLQIVQCGPDRGEGLFVGA